MSAIDSSVPQAAGSNIQATPQHPQGVQARTPASHAMPHAAPLMSFDSRGLLLAGSAALAVPVAVWLARRLSSPHPAAVPEDTGFEAYLKRQAPNPCATVAHAATSFEAYLKAAPANGDTGSAAASAQPAQQKAAPPPPGSKPVTVLYGTEYGFSKEVAESACERLGAGGEFW